MNKREKKIYFYKHTLRKEMKKKTREKKKRMPHFTSILSEVVALLRGTRVTVHISWRRLQLQIRGMIEEFQVLGCDAELCISGLDAVLFPAPRLPPSIWTFFPPKEKRFILFSASCLRVCVRRLLP